MKVQNMITLPRTTIKNTCSLKIPVPLRLRKQKVPQSRRLKVRVDSNNTIYSNSLLIERFNYESVPANTIPQLDGTNDTMIKHTKYARCKKRKFEHTQQQKEFQSEKRCKYSDEEDVDSLRAQWRPISEEIDLKSDILSNHGNFLAKDKYEVRKRHVRIPFFIFSLLKKEKKNNLKYKLNELLENIKDELPGFKIGAALKSRESFFDSIAQGLNELKDKGQIISESRFNVKSLRKLCKTYAKLVNDSKISWLSVALQKGAYQINEYISRIKITAEDIECKCSDDADNPVQGRPEIEGKIICDIYSVAIRIIKLKDEQDGLYLFKDKVGKGQNVIHVLCYRKQFVPLLSNIKTDIIEKTEIPREEVYGRLSRKRQRLLDTDHETVVAKTTIGPTETDNQNNKRISDEFNPNSFRLIPYGLIELMYQLDVFMLCSLRKLEYTQKYPSLSLAFKESNIEIFNDISLYYKGKAIHMHIQNVDKFFLNNSVNYSNLFCKSKTSFSIIRYFKSFVNCLLQNPENSAKNIKFVVVYTNANLDLAEDNTLKKRQVRSYYPFKFEILRKCSILKDILLIKENGRKYCIYKISKDKIARSELFKILELSPSLQKRLKLSEYEELKEQFLDKLVFIVNQPNREELNSLIKDEIKKTIAIDETDYLAFHEKLLRNVIKSKKLEPVNAIIECNLLMSFLHDMFLFKKVSSINMESDGFYNDIVINYRDSTTNYVRVHYATSLIHYGELFPIESIARKNKFSINNCFALFVEKLKTNQNINHFIIISNEGFALTEENELKRNRSKCFYPIRIDSIDIQSEDYKFLKHHSGLSKNELYRFSKRDTPRLLRLLKLPAYSLALEKDGKLTNKIGREIKEQFLNGLIFAVNQSRLDGLNNMLSIGRDRTPFNIEELREISLRWIESHAFGSITNKVIEKMYIDIKNNKSSSNQTMPTYSDEQIKFTVAVVGKKDTPEFFRFLDFLTKREGKKYLENLRREGIRLSSISNILYKTGGVAPIAFEQICKLWFDKDGKKTKYLETFQRENIKMSYISSLLSMCGVDAAATFKDLHEMLFDESGNCTKYLKSLKEAGISFSVVSGILNRSGVNTVEAIESLYDLWFDKTGCMSHYLRVLKEEGIKLTNVAGLLHKSGINGASNFKALFELWFDEAGRKTKYLKSLDEERIKLSHVTRILHSTASATVFKDLYSLWFDEDGKKTHVLKNLKENGIHIDYISRIAYRLGMKAAKSFQDFNDLLFYKDGQMTKYMKSFMREGIEFKQISKILYAAGFEAASEALKDLYNMWFDQDGNPTKYLRVLKSEKVKISSMTRIFYRARTKAASEFKNLYDMWFDEKGKKSRYLRTLKAKGLSLGNIIRVLHFAGTKAATAFKNLYDVWFNEDGSMTTYLKTLTSEGLTLGDIASILYASGGNSGKSFRELYDLWFDKDGNMTKYLKTLTSEGITLGDIASILYANGANAAKSFRELYYLWFDEDGNKTKFLKKFNQEGISLSFLKSCLDRMGRNAGKSFRSLYDFWFDEDGKKTNHLKLLENEGIDIKRHTKYRALKSMYKFGFDEEGNKTKYLKKLNASGVNLAIISRILSVNGAYAAVGYKTVYDIWFDAAGNKRPYPRALEKEDINLKIISKVLKGTGPNIAEVFKNLCQLWFNINGIKTQYLQLIEKEGINVGTLCKILVNAGASAPTALKGLFNMWFDNKGNKTKYLRNFESNGISLNTVSTSLYGQGKNAPRAFIDIYKNYFDEKGNKKQNKDEAKYRK